MARLHFEQPSFIAGELSARLDGRTDIKRYGQGLSILANGIVRVHGGVERRAGTRYVAAAKSDQTAAILVAFEFSDVQAYILEFGELYIRFYTDGGQIQSGGSPYEIVSPYAATDLSSLRWVQSADTLFLVHPSHPPRTLTRSDHTAWTLSDIEFINGPYLDPNTDATRTITPSATTGTVTLTAAGFTPFTADHVGALWQITHGATTGYVRVTVFTDSTHVNAEVKKDLGATTATPDWREGAWSVARGFPRAVTLHEERAWYAGTDNEPLGVWASKSQDFVDMTPGANDADPIDVNIASNKVNVIRWLFPSGDLLVGTLGDEFLIRPPVTSGAITPSNIQQRPQSSYGSADIAPVSVGESVIFVQRAGRKLRELQFDFNIDRYRGRDIALLAEHLFRASQLTAIAIQREPDQILWGVRADGILLGLTFDRNEEVVAWHRHITAGTFESVAVIPHPNGDRDQIWVLVQRTIAGVSRRFIELFEDVEGYYETYELDSALQYVGAPTSAVAGLDHLIGASVGILGDGAVHPSQIVAGDGTVTLQTEASIIEVGLEYTSTFQTMRPDVSMPDGSSSQNRMRSWGSISLRVIDSLGGTINGERMEVRTSAHPMDEAVPLFTGILTVQDLGWDLDGFVLVIQDQPLPFELLSIHGIFVVED